MISFIVNTLIQYFELPRENMCCNAHSLISNALAMRRVQAIKVVHIGRLALFR